MIFRKALQITTIDPVITSSSSATADAAHTLKYIPGAMLWGAAAAQNYPDSKEAWPLFHSGDLRISDGFPFVDGHINWPAPYSLHLPKGSAFEQGDLPNKVQCGAAEDLDRDQQMVQIKTALWHLGQHLKLNSPKTVHALKTAVDPNSGTAARAQLFAIEALAGGGQDFIAWIEGDENRVEEITSSLIGIRYLGRSRSAEYGKVLINPATFDYQHQSVICKKAFVLALSDLILTDELGQPTLMPTARTLGAEFGRIDWSHSFLRFRRYAPYNAEWRSRNLERQTIERGSVICLASSNIKSGLHWVGEGNSSGAGLILVSPKPPLEMIRELKLQISCSRKPGETTSETEASGLVSWLQASALQAEKQTQEFEKTTTIAREILSLLDKAKNRAGGMRVGPGKSQWMAVRAHIQDYIRQSASGHHSLEEKLWGTNGVASKVDEDWDVFFTNNGKNVEIWNFRTWLQETIRASKFENEKLSALAKSIEIASKEMEVQ